MTPTELTKIYAELGFELIITYMIRCRACDERSYCWCHPLGHDNPKAGAVITTDRKPTARQARNWKCACCIRIAKLEDMKREVRLRHQRERQRAYRSRQKPGLPA